MSDYVFGVYSKLIAFLMEMSGDIAEFSGASDQAAVVLTPSVDFTLATTPWHNSGSLMRRRYFPAIENIPTTNKKPLTTAPESTGAVVRLA